MRRIWALLTIVSLLLVVLTLAAWLYTATVAHLHLGRERVEIDVHGTRQAYRSGLFAADGRLTWGTGTEMHWLGIGEMKQPPSVGDRRGLFAGSFSYWAASDSMRTLLGFGRFKDAQLGYVIIGDRNVVSVPMPFVAMTFLVLPIWVWADRRFRLLRSQFITGLVVTYVTLVVWTYAAWYERGLAIAILLTLAGHGIWASWYYGFRGWRLRRARERAHLCHICGYDLRATADANGPLLERCPECGTYSHPLIRNHS